MTGHARPSCLAPRPVSSAQIAPFRLASFRAYNRTTVVREEPFLPNRRSVRLRAFDYSQPCSCFVTICCQRMKPLFGSVVGSSMALSALGKIANECWLGIPGHFPQVELGPHVVMPNHVHGILIIRNVPVESRQNLGDLTATDGRSAAKHLGRARHVVPLRSGVRARASNAMSEPVARAFASPVAGSIALIVSAFKAAVSRHANARSGVGGKPLWQRGYYDHVIRDERDFRNACDYIRTNPGRWTFANEREPF
jgi:putative transposase